MKKIIFVLVSIITMVFVSSCTKDNPINDIQEDVTPSQFISIDGIYMDLSSPSVKIMDKCFKSEKSISTFQIYLGNLVKETIGTNYAISTYNKIIEFDFVYANSSVNEKTNIVNINEIYIAGATHLVTQEKTPNNTTSTWELTKDGKGVGVAYYKTALSKVCCSMTMTPTGDEKEVEDSFVSGWYLVKEVSSYKLNISGEFKTEKGHEVKFNFEVLK